MYSDQHLKWLSLALLTIQTAGFVLMAKRSRIPDNEGHLYRTSTAVMMLELSKLIASTLVLYTKSYRKARQESGSTQYQYLLDNDKEEGGEYEAKSDAIIDASMIPISIQAARKVKETLFNGSGLQLLYPATAFAIQNVLQLRAATYLQPAVFQVFNQAKLFMTALFAYILLRKQLSVIQWASLGILATGIVVVQLGSTASKISVQNPADISLGFFLMMIVSVCSGFAGVFTELFLKRGNDFWATNAQMAAFSLPPAILMLTIESVQLGSFHIFEYFGGWAISTVLMNAVGGLIVSMVFKYADSILKGFAIAAAIVLTVVINVVLMGARFSFTSLFGILAVLLSVFLYSAASLFSRKKTANAKDSAPHNAEKGALPIYIEKNARLSKEYPAVISFRGQSVKEYDRESEKAKLILS